MKSSDTLQRSVFSYSISSNSWDTVPLSGSYYQNACSAIGLTDSLTVSINGQTGFSTSSSMMPAAVIFGGVDAQNSPQSDITIQWSPQYNAVVASSRSLGPTSVEIALVSVLSTIIVLIVGFIIGCSVWCHRRNNMEQKRACSNSLKAKQPLKLPADIRQSQSMGFLNESPAQSNVHLNASAKTQVPLSALRRSNTNAGVKASLKAAHVPHSTSFNRPMPTASFLSASQDKLNAMDRLSSAVVNLPTLYDEVAVEYNHTNALRATFYSRYTHYEARELSALNTNQNTSIGDASVVSLPLFLATENKNWLKLDSIGKGGFATIYKASPKNPAMFPEAVRSRVGSFTMMAMKVLDQPDDIPAEDFIAAFRQEVSIMHAMSSCANITRLIAFIDAPTPTIICQLYHGNLAAELANYKDSKWSPLELKIKIARDIVRGMGELHGIGVIHNDLKPENILMDYAVDDEQLLKPTAVITDFGVSGLLDHYEKVTGRQKSVSFGVSPNYTAPEVLQRILTNISSEIKPEQVGTVTSDIYSFGMVMYFIITRQPAFAGEDWKNIIKMVTNGKRPQFPESVEQDWTELIEMVEKCWNNVPSARFQSFADVDAALRSHHI